jgi:outer membrane protein assembly factor BamB
VDGDVAYVGAENGVYATRGGTKVWAAGPLPAARRFVALGEGKVVVTSYTIGDKRHGFADQTASDVNRRENGHVTAFNAADGAQLWDLPFDPEGSRLSPPAIAQGRVLVVSGMRLVALDAATGQPAWSQPLLKEKGAFSKLNAGHPWARVAPAVADGKVCAIAWYHAALFDLASGQQLAEDRFADYGTASLVSAPGGCFYAIAKSGEGGFGGRTQVIRIDVGRSTKHLRKDWNEKDWSDRRDLGISALKLTQGALYAISNFRLKAIDPTSGKKLWEVKDEPVSPVARARGTRTKHLARGIFGEAYNFTMDTSAGAVWNDWPGTGLAANDSTVFVAASYKDPNADKKAPGRDVVTAIDAKSGAYRGSYDAGGAVVLDLATTPDGALLLATDQGLKTVRADSFAAVAQAR